VRFFSGGTDAERGGYERALGLIMSSESPPLCFLLVSQ
jgi:hypothetical protein